MIIYQIHRSHLLDVASVRMKGFIVTRVYLNKMEYFDNKAKAFIKRHVEETFEKIDVEPGQTIHYKCHMNSVYYAMRGDE